MPFASSTLPSAVDLSSSTQQAIGFLYDSILNENNRVQQMHHVQSTTSSSTSSSSSSTSTAKGSVSTVFHRGQFISNYIIDATSNEPTLPAYAAALQHVMTVIHYMRYTKEYHASYHMCSICHMMATCLHTVWQMITFRVPTFSIHYVFAFDM